MLQKVKKFRDRIFSASQGRKDGSYSGTDGFEDGAAPGSESMHSSSRTLTSVKSKNSSYNEHTPEPNHGSKRTSPNGPHGKLSVTLKEAPMLQDHNMPSPRSALPPVQIGSSNNSFSAKAAGGAPVNLALVMSPSNGRRKSTPAALDMVLRTAEGKAAVEQLLQPNAQKQLVFGNYFAGTSAAARDQAAAQAAAEKQRAKAAMPPKYPKQQQPGPPPVPQHVHAADAGMATVPEDVAMEDIPAAQAAHARPPGPADSLSSLQDAPLLKAVVQPAPPPPQAAPPAPAPEEPSTSNRNTKLVALSPQLPASMQRKHWHLADYNIIRKMYTGYASTVYQALCKKSLDMVALKVYHMENLCELNHYQVFREIRVHSSLQHQNIIHLFAAFQEGTDVVLVQEYAEGGDLYRLLHKNGGRLSERQAVEMVLHPFLLSLHYLHMRGIMHRDIKPENVLFTDQRVLKLADFGLAIDLTEERAVTRAGTLDYMAPEVLRCPPKNLPQENKNNPYLHYNNSVDAWAVGVFAYELVVGFPPFAGETQLDSVDKIMHSVPQFPEKISEFAKDFICQCLRKHPGDRPTVMELLHHPWIRTFQRRTSMRITAAPRRRSSVTYNPSAGPIAAAVGGVGGYAPHEAAAADADCAAPMDTDVNYNEMTPEQIENMIRKLQVAKQQALEKSNSNSPRHLLMQPIMQMGP